MSEKSGGKNGKRIVMVNCWDFYHCPRERQLACPAFHQDAGRSCWSVSGTLCGGEATGVNTMMPGTCSVCDFYLQVRAGDM